MPRLINLFSLVSLVSLASLAKCRPVTYNDLLDTFTLSDGPFLDPPPLFTPGSGVPEIPQELGESSFQAATLDVPLGTTSGFFAESIPFDVAGGPICRIPSLTPTCCSGSAFEAGSCQWGSACIDTQVQLCCAQQADATPTNCEPPKEPVPPSVANFGGGLISPSDFGGIDDLFGGELPFLPN